MQLPEYHLFRGDELIASSIGSTQTRVGNLHDWGQEGDILLILDNLYPSLHAWMDAKTENTDPCWFGLDLSNETLNHYKTLLLIQK